MYVEESHTGHHYEPLVPDDARTSIDPRDMYSVVVCSPMWAFVKRENSEEQPHTTWQTTCGTTALCPQPGLLPQ
eukprot:12918781-Prorocentrum_lima.AAC.1